MNPVKNLGNIEIEEGYVISDSLLQSEYIDVSHYALSNEETISYEKSGDNKMYIGLTGIPKLKVKKDSEKVYPLNNFDGIYLQKNTFREIFSEGKFSFLMITFKRRSEMIKNLTKEVVFNLRDEVAYQENKIISKTLANDEKVTMTLLSFDGKQELSTHSAPGDALVVALDGEAKIVIDGKENIVKKDESIIMPANLPHSVHIAEGSKFQMLLVVSK